MLIDHRLCPHQPTTPVPDAWMQQQLQAMHVVMYTTKTESLVLRLSELYIYSIFYFFSACLVVLNLKAWSVGGSLTSLVGRVKKNQISYLLTLTPRTPRHPHPPTTADRHFAETQKVGLNKSNKLPTMATSSTGTSTSTVVVVTY